MDAQTRAELKEAIHAYNSRQDYEENKINMQDLLSEIGSLDNEEVQKAVEILKSNTENGEY